MAWFLIGAWTYSMYIRYNMGFDAYSFENLFGVGFILMLGLVGHRAFAKNE